MQKWLFIVAICLPVFLSAQPCNLTNSTGCDCLDGSNNCDLLPDIGVAKQLLTDPSENTEYPGELALSVSTTNVGHGPLRVIPTDYFVCDGDTIYSPGGFTGSCPSGSDAKQLIRQRIYHKNPDGSMTSTDRDAGSMTYHASHGHMHVDDWGIYTLRTEVPGTDPLTWPIVAEGAKLGFCLMDFGSCATYFGHCRDAAGAVLTTDAPNFGLGGGLYSCGSTNQGISAGYTDIYGQYLDGMQITLPSSICNGNYMVVVEVDPANNFLEENEDNNVVAVPVTLTLQGGGEIQILADGPVDLCEGETVTLTINDATALNHLWSTGDTTSSIVVGSSGSYSCTASTNCGSKTATDFIVTVLEPGLPIAIDDTTCGPGFVNLNVTPTVATASLNWYDAPVGGTLVSTGSSWVTPSISTSTTYYVEQMVSQPGLTGFVGPPTHSGTNQYNGTSFNAYQVFDVYKELTLKSVNAIAGISGNRTIELRNDTGLVLQAKTVYVDTGESRIILDFLIAPGTNYQLGTSSAANMAEFGYESPSLKRTSGGTMYPYDFADIASVTTTQFGTSYWYYLYDWELMQSDLICSGPRTPIHAIVDNSCVDNCPIPLNPVVLSVTPTGATVTWDAVSGAAQYQIYGKKTNSSIWQSVITTSNIRTVNILKPNKNYLFTVRAKCPGPILSPFSDTVAFNTPPLKLGDELIGFELYPNPSAGDVSLNIVSGESQDITVEVQDNLGRQVFSRRLGNVEEGEELVFDFSQFADGLYLIRLHNGVQSWGKRLLIQR